MDLTEDARDLPGGLLGLIGQAPHLCRDHTEAATVLAGSGCLDGRVQREEVGLLADLVHRRDDLGDGLGPTRQGGDRLRDELHL